jgi:hypothetical protein
LEARIHVDSLANCNAAGETLYLSILSYNFAPYFFISTVALITKPVLLHPLSVKDQFLNLDSSHDFEPPVDRTNMIVGRFGEGLWFDPTFR